MRFSALSLLFAVDGSQVDEEYHHTQLLQTKVQHPKVAVDAQGLAHDETVLLQAGVGKMIKKARAHAAKAQFMRSLTKKEAKVKQVGGPRAAGKGDRSKGGSSPMGGGPDNMGTGNMAGGPGPTYMGGGPDNMGPGNMGGGPGPMGGGPDNMGPGNMGGGPGPTYMGGGPDNMGPGNMGGGPGPMGGGPDNMGPGNMGGGPGPTYMGGGPDNMGPGNMGGGPGPMGGGPDNMRPGNMGGGPGPTYMGGGPDNMGPGNMGGGPGPTYMGGGGGGPGHPGNMGGGPGPTYMGGGPGNMGGGGPGPTYMGGGPDNMGPGNMGGGPGPTYMGGGPGSPGPRGTGGRGPKGPENHDDGEEACKAFYFDRVEECMGCGHGCMERHPCDGEECLHSEPFMMCHGECMGSPLGGEQSSEGCDACMEFYPGREGECMECGGHCMEDFPCHDRDSCMASEGFMHCHTECMFDPEMGGEDEGERACKDFYPGEFDQCMECGGHCVEENPCEGAQDCMENQGFMHCHGECMMTGYDPSNDPEVKEGCMMFYGEDVNVPQCFECGWGCTAEIPPEAWQDPNTFKDVMQCSDQCMGMDNLVSPKCVEGYGEDVDVMQCISCGFMCGCSSEGCDEECHANCMGSGHEEYHDEGVEECKEFYGKDVDLDKCLSCAGECYEQAGEFGTDPAEWFNAFINCQDNCVGTENRATGMCKELGGEGVDITRCFTCGMGCCERLDDCKGNDGAGASCMNECYHSEEQPPQPWDTYSSWDTYGNYSSSFGNHSSWDTYGNHSSWDTFGNHSSWDTYGNYSSWDTYGNWSDTYGNWSDTSGGNWSDTSGGNWSDTSGGKWSSDTSGGSWSTWPSSSSFGSWDSSMGWDSFQSGDPAGGKPTLLFGRRLRQDVADGTDLMQVKKHLKKNIQK